MVGAIIAGAVGLASLITSGVMSAQNNKKQKESLERQQSNADTAYAKELSLDPLDRSDNVHALRFLSDKLDGERKKSLSASAIGGGTSESDLAASDLTNKAYAGAVSSIASDEVTRDEGIRKEMFANNQVMNARMDANTAARQQTYANLTKGAGDLLASSLQSIDIPTGEVARELPKGELPPVAVPEIEVESPSFDIPKAELDILKTHGTPDFSNEVGAPKLDAPKGETEVDSFLNSTNSFEELLNGKANKL